MNKHLLGIVILFTHFFSSIYSQSIENTTKIYDFSICKNDDYKNCFSNIENPKVFNFSKLKNRNEVEKTHNAQLNKFIFENLDQDFFLFFEENLHKKDSVFFLNFTYYRNLKGEVIADLVGSNLKRKNYELHKKLVFLLTQTTTKKGKFTGQLKGKQFFNLMKLKFDHKTKTFSLSPYKTKKIKKNPNDSISAPVFKGCPVLANKYSEETHEAQKKCMEEKISSFVISNFDKKLIDKARFVLAEKYKIYGKELKSIARFWITKDGNINKIEAVGMIHEIEDEIIKILNKIPKIEPSTEKGEPISMLYSLPITFKTNPR